MRLLDAVRTETKTGNWEQGWDGDARQCGVSLYISDACDPAETTDVLEPKDEQADEVCTYRVRPFGYIASLRRPVRMEHADDQTWLKNALADSNEIAIARSLFVRQNDSDVWLGNPDVQQVTDPGTTNMTAYIAAISEARRLYFRSSVYRPIMHVSPDIAPALKVAGVIDQNASTGTIDSNIWGDPVVISEGYYVPLGMTSVPKVFFTGPMQVVMTDVMDEQQVRQIRTNRSLTEVTQVAAIDSAPCAMVRVGAAPA